MYEATRKAPAQAEFTLPAPGLVIPPWDAPLSIPRWFVSSSQVVFETSIPAPESNVA
jgi:hypothetical protein